MAEKNIVIKSVDELTPGYVMMENIGTYKDLQQGVILDKTRINLLKSLGVKHVTVLEQAEDHSDRLAKSHALGQEISKNIEEIFQREKIQEQKEVYYQPIIEDDFIEEDRKEAKTILEHVVQSRKDIITIEGGEKVSIKQINKEVDKTIKNFELILKKVFFEKSVNIDELKEIVNSFILLTGPKRESSFLLLGVVRKEYHLLIKHAVNTCLLSLAIAIEMSKIMDEQLQKEEVKGDFKKLKICNFKIFNRDELIKLGIAAILCDLSLIDVLPNLDKDTPISSKDISKIHLHPSRAFNFLSNSTIDFDIRKAILQHHERADTSGYPDGIEKRSFTKYSLVLSFADYYEFKTSSNPFEKKMHPQKALLEILQKERMKFDDDVIFAFCKSASMYPIGSWVILSDDSVGIVIKPNKHDLKNPLVKVAYSPDLKEMKLIKFIDLSNSKLFIKDIIDVESIELIDKRYDRFIFDEREFDRITLIIVVDFQISGSNVTSKCQTIDISAGGVQIRTGSNLSKGQHLFLDFQLGEKNFKQIKSIVAWKKENGKEDYSYGVRFLEMPFDEYNFIQTEVHRLIEEQDAGLPHEKARA